MSSTSAYETGSARTAPTLQDEIVLFRPRGVYTGEFRSKRTRSRDSSSGSTTDGYTSERHRQPLSRAVKAILKSEDADAEAKVLKELALQDWVPMSSSLDPIISMEGLCIRFARLAAEL